MGFFGWLTGAKTADKAMDTINNVTDHVASGLDKLFFTDQEKAQVSMETAQLHLKLIETTMNESSIRSITRRVLAWLIMGTFMLLIVACAIVWRFNGEWAKFIFECAGQIYELVLMVGFFYFGYYAVSSVVKKAKE